MFENTKMTDDFKIRIYTTYVFSYREFLKVFPKTLFYETIAKESALTVKPKGLARSVWNDEVVTQYDTTSRNHRAILQSPSETHRVLLRVKAGRFYRVPPAHKQQRGNYQIAWHSGFKLKMWTREWTAGTHVKTFRVFPAQNFFTVAILMDENVRLPTHHFERELAWKSFQIQILTKIGLTKKFLHEFNYHGN